MSLSAIRAYICKYRVFFTLKYAVHRWTCDAGRAPDWRPSRRVHKIWRSSQIGERESPRLTTSRCRWSDAQLRTTSAGHRPSAVSTSFRRCCDVFDVVLTSDEMLWTASEVVEDSGVAAVVDVATSNDCRPQPYRCVLSTPGETRYTVILAWNNSNYPNYYIWLTFIHASISASMFYVAVLSPVAIYFERPLSRPKTRLRTIANNSNANQY